MGLLLPNTLRARIQKAKTPLRATVIRRGEPAGVERKGPLRVTFHPAGGARRRRRMTWGWLSAVLVRHSRLICPSPLALTVHRAFRCPECTERGVRGRPGRTCRVLKGRFLPGRTRRVLKGRRPHLAENPPMMGADKVGVFSFGLFIGAPWLPVLPPPEGATELAQQPRVPPVTYRF